MGSGLEAGRDLGQEAPLGRMSEAGQEEVWLGMVRGGWEEAPFGRTEGAL